MTDQGIINHAEAFLNRALSGRLVADQASAYANVSIAASLLVIARNSLPVKVGKKTINQRTTLPEPEN